MNAAFKGDEGWPGITDQLKRRYVSVRNLVDTARSAMSDEDVMLEKHAEVRSEVFAALAMDVQETVAGAGSRRTTALGSFVTDKKSSPEQKGTENLALA